MPQGWKIDATADTITFNEAPAAGVDNIVVTEYAAGALGGTAKFAMGAWSDAYGYPSEVEFYADRLWWANTPSDPQMVWGSEIGAYSSHGRSTPMVDSDAVSFAMNTRQVNAVVDLVPLDKLVILAKGGEFLMTGGQDDVITPSTIAIKQQSHRGANNAQAKIAGDTAIFVQEQGSRVCDIGYRFEADGYRPVDISVWASHLCDGYELTRIEWAPAPHSCLWFVRDDGTAIGCTYMPEQEVIGWHRHDTGRSLATGEGDDEIEDIVCLPGSRQTEVFLLVKRVVDGVVTRYIEQVAHEHVDDIRDWVYCDSSLTYDGRNSGARTLRLTGGTTWAEGEELSLIASGPIFSGPSDVGDGFDLSITVKAAGDDGVIVGTTHTARVTIVEFQSSSAVKVQPIGTIPAALRDAQTRTWAFKRGTIGGFGHLEGRTLAVLVDGSVHAPCVVVDGTITLEHPGGVVTAGLPYRGHIETLELNNPGSATIRDAKKLLTSVGVLVQDSRGVKVCGGELREDYTYDLPQREFEDWGEPTRPLTGYGEVPVSGEWGENVGRVHVLSDDPLPMTVLGVIPRFLTSDRTG